ncbi:MAG TPA: glycosyltransferase, partial [Rhodopila sp.]|uniref:glycosyltransferase n=1 Tax=Rhodopila sp. TaxID=2480087 RepID=UPI002C3EF150
EARQYFAAGEVDLLHIDGVHTYEAAAADFHLWRETLSNRGVVLFHDINVRKRGFGIWRLWQELKADHPHFEFVHGHGLGVLGLGGVFPEPLRALFAAAKSPGATAEIRGLFAARGEVVNLRWAVQETEAKLRAAEAERDAGLDMLWQAEQETVMLRAQAAEAERLARERAELAVRCDALLRSSSWRITRPLRAAIALARGNPAYVAQLGRLPGVRTATFPIMWAGSRLRRANRMAAFALRLSQRVGGPVSLMRRGVQVLHQQGLTGLRSKLRQLEVESARNEDAVAIAQDIFAQQQSELSPELARQMQDDFEIQPLISVIMPVYKTPVQWLRRAVESLLEQYYDRWELCAVDDCSPDDDQRKLLQEFAASDVRVRFRVMERNGGISAASNAALEMAQGEYVALLDHDDELTPDALFRVAEAINRQPDADFFYSDECKVSDTASRRLHHFIFKPDWSPEFMFNAMLTGHLTVYRKDLVENVGRFRSEYDYSQDYDLALRAAEVAKRIVHIERLLYLWRSIPGSAAAGGKDFARETNIRALDDALRRRGIPGKAIPLPEANCVRIALPKELPLVSIVIPSDSAKNLRLVLNSVREETGYPNFEVVVVCNGPLADRLMEEFSEWPALRFLKYDKKYNFSDKCNEGAEAARGEIVVFYNDDVFPLQRDWVERLIEYLWVPGVGGVSPKLLHDDDTIQYAGMISGTPGLCGTAYNNVPKDGLDPFLTMHRYVRNVSILSGACCAFRKGLFQEVGAFDAANTRDGHSDMDLSYKLVEAGYRCVYTPHALLRHIGNHSWNAKSDKYKADIYALKRWGALVSKDPYFTNSMKQVLYKDFRFDYRIYAEHLDPREHYTGPDVLFVSHELTLTGAPRMLFYAANVVRRNGGFPLVVAPADGPMRAELIKAGIAVIIDESICHNHFLFERFARNFDLAVVNSVALVDVVRQLSAIPILRTLWWLHEAQSLSSDLKRLSGVEWKRVCTICVSDYARSFVPPGIAVEVLRNGIPDQPVAPEPRNPTAPLTFVLTGTIEPRKGQDLLVEAVALLPPEVRRQCRFLLTGKLWDSHRSFWNGLKAKMADLPEIEYLGLLDHQSQLRLIASADMVVCCSRDDAASLVAAEAAMLSRPIILSSRVGLIEVLDHDSCLVFEPENAVSLAEKLLAAYEKRSDLPRMGMVARHRFEQELTIDTFSCRFMALVSRQIVKGEILEKSSEASVHQTAGSTDGA